MRTGTERSFALDAVRERTQAALRQVVAYTQSQAHRRFRADLAALQTALSSLEADLRRLGPARRPADQQRAVDFDDAATVISAEDLATVHARLEQAAQPNANMAKITEWAVQNVEFGGGRHRVH